MTLITQPNLDRVDDVYQRLVAAMDGLEDEESARFNARLILTLMNHIGDEAVITAAIDLTKAAAPPRHAQTDAAPGKAAVPSGQAPSGCADTLVGTGRLRWPLIEEGR